MKLRTVRKEDINSIKLSDLESRIINTEERLNKYSYFVREAVGTVGIRRRFSHRPLENPYGFDFYCNNNPLLQYVSLTVFSISTLFDVSIKYSGETVFKARVRELPGVFPKLIVKIYKPGDWEYELDKLIKNKNEVFEKYKSGIEYKNQRKKELTAKMKRLKLVY